MLIGGAFSSRHLLNQWELLIVRHGAAQREDLEDKFEAGGDGERRKPHTWKTKLAVNSVLLSPINLSRFVTMPRSFIFCEALQQASQVRLRFYSPCKFSAARSAKFLVFKWDPSTSNNFTVSHYTGNSSSFSCLFFSKSSFNLIVIWIFISKNQQVSQWKHSIKT